MGSEVNNTYWGKLAITADFSGVDPTNLVHRVFTDWCSQHLTDHQRKAEEQKWNYRKLKCVWSEIRGHEKLSYM